MCVSLCLWLGLRVYACVCDLWLQQFDTYIVRLPLAAFGSSSRCLSLCVACCLRLRLSVRTPLSSSLPASVSVSVCLSCALSLSLSALSLCVCRARVLCRCRSRGGWSRSGRSRSGSVKCVEHRRRALSCVGVSQPVMCSLCACIPAARASTVPRARACVRVRLCVCRCVGVSVSAVRSAALAVDVGRQAQGDRGDNRLPTAALDR